jgi:PTS system mannose-specific IIA component
MIGGLIVTHGRLAIELLNAAEAILGDVQNIVAVSIGWHDDVDMASSMVEKAIKRVDAGSGVLVLTDMFGGTPTNIASTFLDEGNIEVVTGVNLPMLIKLIQIGDEVDLASAARLVRENGQNNIYIASELLSPPSRS